MMPIVKLGDVALEVKETYKGEKNGYPIVGLEHITPEEVTLSNWSVDTENTFTKMFYKDDILFGRRRAYLKKAAIAPFDGICSGDITVIRAKSGKLLPMLLPFVIQNDDFFEYAVGKSAGSLSPRVKWEHLKNYEFRLPSLEKQKELADLLWAINDSRKAYQELIRETDELIKSQFIEMFGDTVSEKQNYETMPLEKIFDKPQAGEWGADDPKGVGTPVLRTTNFTDEGHIDYSDVATRIIEENKVAKKAICNGDILIEKSGGSSDKPVGRVVFYEGEDGMYLNNNFTACLHLNGVYQINRLYAFYFMFVNYWSGGTELFEGKTTGIHNLRLGDYLKSTNIPLAPLELQEEFEIMARQSDKSKFELKQAIEGVDNLIRSLVQQELQ